MLRYLAQSSFLSGTLAIFALAGVATVSDRPARAQTGNPCHLLTSAQSVPDGFGAAYNLFSAAKELLLEVECGSSSNATLTVGNGQNTMYVYRFGYEWNGSAWKQIALSGSQLAAEDWYVGNAKANLFRSQSQLAEDNFVVAYTCLWQNNAWKCGCRDANCSQNYWQLQAFRQAPPATGGGGSSNVTPCSNPKTFNVTPSTIQSTLTNNKGACLVLNLSPGTYNEEIDTREVAGVTLRCTVPAMANGKPNPSGCVSTSRYGVLAWKMYGTLIVEDMVFKKPWTDSPHPGGYGIRLWHASQVRIANNVFIGNYNHDISTKHNVRYAEVLSNTFNCADLCIDSGQEGNHPGEDWQSGTLVVRGNTFVASRKAAIHNFNTTHLIVENNTFGPMEGGYAIANMEWANTDGDSGDGLLIPAGDLRTDILHNTLRSSDGLVFYGRGSLTDTVLVKGNTGGICSRRPMQERTSTRTHNEQTTAPPKLDPASDVPC